MDDYLSAFPAEIRIRLEQIRKVILKAAPEAREGISFYIPAYQYHGNLVRFAAYDRHIGFYPGAGAIQAFKTALAPYACSKGAVHLPLHGPLPLKLLREMILFRVKENMEKQDLKSMTSIAGKKKKTCPRGHVFYKSSDCPVCPVCASLARPREGFLSKISAPARRALEAKGILELSQLSKYTEQEILSLHGIGNKVMIELRLALEEKGLSFKAAGGPVSAEKA